MSNEMQQLGSQALQIQQSQYQTTPVAQIGAGAVQQGVPQAQIANESAAPRFIFRDFASI